MMIATNSGIEITAQDAINEFGFDAIVNFMDNGIREQVHAIGIEDEVEFLEEYSKRMDLILG